MEINNCKECPCSFHIEYGGFKSYETWYCGATDAARKELENDSCWSHQSNSPKIKYESLQMEFGNFGIKVPKWCPIRKTSLMVIEVK